MAGLLERIDRARSAPGGDEQRSGIDTWISQYLIPWAGQFSYGGQTYPYGTGTSLNQTLAGNRVAEIAQSIPGYRMAMMSSPPVFAAQAVRTLILSQARFTFRNPPWWNSTPRRLFGTADLQILATPWPNGTTADLIARMELHAGLAGNSFVTRQPGRLRVLRPDWTAILYGSQREPAEYAAWALDAELLGYVYRNQGGGDVQFLLPRDVAHWAPLPDPEMAGLGMSWMTPAIREMQGDRLATEHKIRFFEQGATPNLVIKGIPAMNPDQFDELVQMMESQHAGAANAYRTLYLTAGADATVVGSNLKDLDLQTVQAGHETRLSMLSRVPAALLGIWEGLQGSTLNSGNFAMARRIFADTWIYPTLQNLASSLAPLINVPRGAELWFDTGDMPVLREDAKDAADIQQIQANTITTLVKDGFSPESAIAAVKGQDMSLLQHTGLVSVQLQPPRTELQQAQTVQTGALSAEALIKSGYTAESVREAVDSQDLSKLVVGPLTSRYLVVNPLEAGAEPGVPLGFPDLPGPATAPPPGAEPPAEPGFSPAAKAGNEPPGGM